MKDVHTEHCCAKHGCKYGEDDVCTVVRKVDPLPQSFPCEECGSVKSQAHEIIQQAIDTLEGIGCTFWACQGPDVPFVQMETCTICAGIQDLRKLLDE